MHVESHGNHVAVTQGSCDELPNTIPHDVADVSLSFEYLFVENRARGGDELPQLLQCPLPTHTAIATCCIGSTQLQLGERERGRAGGREGERKEGRWGGREEGRNK